MKIHIFALRFVSRAVPSHRFGTFRRVLDAEMKDATRCGLTVSTKKDEKEAITDEEEDLFWSKGLMGTGSSNSLLNTVYFYNGKLFGLRGGEHGATSEYPATHLHVIE